MLSVEILAGNSLPTLPRLHPQSLEVVLYYQASHTNSDDPPKEEAGEREETEEEPKQEFWDKLVSEHPHHVEMKSAENEDKGFKEPQDQEGKEEDSRDEEDDSRPEASEENPLKISESRKVTTAKAGPSGKWALGLSGPSVQGGPALGWTSAGEASEL